MSLADAPPSKQGPALRDTLISQAAAAQKANGRDGGKTTLDVLPKRAAARDAVGRWYNIAVRGDR